MATAGPGKYFVDPRRPTPTGDWYADSEAKLDWLEEAPIRVRAMMKKMGNDPAHVVKKMVNTGPPPVDDSRDAAASNSKHSTRGEQMQ